MIETNGIPLIRIRYNAKLKKEDVEELLSGIPLKQSVGQPAAKPDENSEGSETIEKQGNLN